MDYGIQGKVALVGGASRGLGRACAEALAREGVRVAICSRRLEAIEETASDLREATGGDVIGVDGDLMHSDDVEDVLDQTCRRFGEIDILVTNTGGPRPGRFGDLQEEDWDQAYELLLKSALRLIRAVLPSMKERRWGRIVGITSVSVKEPIENLLLSNVFRAGVTSLYKSLAREVAAYNITMNTVLPGLTDTERLRELFAGMAEAEGVSLDEKLKQVAEGLPRRRLNRPEELGELTAFLASEAAAGISGCAIPVDGAGLKGLF